jgi:peroxiredoxin
MKTYIILSGISRFRSEIPAEHHWHDWPRYERQAYLSRPIKREPEPAAATAVVTAAYSLQPRLRGVWSYLCRRVIPVAALVGFTSSAFSQAEDENMPLSLGAMQMSTEQLQWLISRMVQRQNLQPQAHASRRSRSGQATAPQPTIVYDADASGVRGTAAVKNTNALADAQNATSQQNMNVPPPAAAATTPAPAAADMPDIQFTAVDGRKVDLASLRGKVVLIDFWATWCGPCMGEIPHVVDAYNKYHEQGFEIIGISFDTNKVTLQRVTEDKGMPWPQYFDGKGWKNDFGVKYGIHAIPTMWLIDQQGKIVTKNARTNLADQVAKLLPPAGGK